MHKVFWLFRSTPSPMNTDGREKCFREIGTLLRLVPRSGTQPRSGATQTRSNVELEEHHVAVLDDVFLAFHAVQAFFAGGRHGTAFHEIVVGDGFGLDKPALEVTVDDAGGFRGGVAGVDG